MTKKLLAFMLAVTMTLSLSLNTVAVTSDSASVSTSQGEEVVEQSEVVDSELYATITTYIDNETSMPIAEFTNVEDFLNQLTQLGMVGSGNLTRVVIDIKQNITSADALKIVTVDDNGNQVDVPVTINGNGHTINGSILIPNSDVTIDDVSIVNSNSSVSAIEINAGKLTLNDVNVSSARHAIRIDGDVEAIINSGNYSVMGTAGMTTHVVNASAGTVTINGGTFTGVKGTAGDSGTTVFAQDTANVTINGGDFSGASSGYGTEPVTATTGTITVYGGTFDQNPAAYVAEGYEYDSATGKVDFVPAGTLGSSLVDMGDPTETYIYAEITGLKATESVVIKTYSGETLIATTTLANAEYFSSSPLGVKICLTGDSSSWDTVWEDGMPRADLVPDSNVLYVDGVEMNTANVPMTSTNGELAVDWATLSGVNPGLSGSGTEEDPYLIGSLDELIWFRDSVNTYTSDGSNQYKGKYVKLTADIDLAGINWTPIGTNSVGDHMAFLGTFDGDGHTISNLYINSDGDHLGFFARVGSYAENVTPTVKNLKFHNVNVSSNTTTGNGGSYVGGVIANAGGNSVVSGITVTGDVYVDGYAYVGGIVGHGYPDIDNCHVTANDGSWVHAYYWCAGGIIGYAGEGGTPITNSSVSGLDIWSASGGAGAVAGLLQYGNTLANVSASNVEITSASDYVMGYIAGNGEESTLTNVTATNVTATANGKEITSTDAVATANGKIYFDLHDAFYENRGKDELTVVLLRDVTYDAALTVANSGTVYVQVNGEYVKKNVAQKTTLDLNGKTFTSTVSDDAALKVLNGASLTITDSVGNGEIVAAYDGVKVGGGGSAATLTVEAGTIEAANVAVDVTKNSVLNVNGGTVTGTNYGAVLGGDNTTINVTDGILSGNAGISSNSAYENTVVNISGGTVQGDALAIYQPQNGTTTISGGTVTGATAINVKSGTLNVTGGTVSGTGAYADHVFTGGSFTPTGDAIVIENAYNYNNAYETPVVSISGGTITSDNAAAVTSYSSGNESDVALTGFITGGTFSSDVSQWLASGNRLEHDVVTETYTVTNLIWELTITTVAGEEEFKDSQLYSNLNELLESYKNQLVTLDMTVIDSYSAAVKLLANVELGEIVEIDLPLTLDLNGKTVTALKGTSGYSDAFRILADVTVTGNGTIDADENGYAFFVGNDTTAGKLTIENGSFYGAPTAAQVTKGELIINGGYFETTEYDGAHEFTLNCKDTYYKSGEAKITVTGGTFYQFNPADNAAEGTGTSFVTEDYEAEYDEATGTYTVRVSKYVAKNVQTGKKYEDISDALDEVKEGETVRLLKDYTETDMVFVLGNVTLDLNGKVLTVENYIASFGDIVDNSTDKTGLLKVSEKAANVVIAEDNSQMPVWNGEGYVFATMKMQVQDTWSNENDSLLIELRPFFGEFTALLADGAANNDIEILVRMTYDTEEGMTGTEEFVCSEDIIRDAYGNVKAIRFNATGVLNRKDASFTVVVKSTTLKVECVSDAITVETIAAPAM